MSNKETFLKKLTSLYSKYKNLIGKSVLVDDYIFLTINDVCYTKDKYGKPFILVNYINNNDERNAKLNPIECHNKIVIYDINENVAAYLNYNFYNKETYIKKLKTKSNYRDLHLASKLIKYLESYSLNNFPKNKITLICMNDDERKSNINSNLPFYLKLGYQQLFENDRPDEEFIDMIKDYKKLKPFYSKKVYIQKGNIFVKGK